MIDAGAATRSIQNAEGHSEKFGERPGLQKRR